MEIALTAFNPQFDSSASVESARQRQQDAQRQSQSQATNERAAENQRNQTRAEANQRTPGSQRAESTRVISGEVLSSETVRVDARQSQTVLTRSSSNQQPAGQPDNRRISAQQAIQTFQENEEMASGNNEQRQVSGIIDIFV